MGNNANAAVCQLADRLYNIGRTAIPIWVCMIITWPNRFFRKQLSPDFYTSNTFTILYPGGYEWRMTNITFVIDEEVDQPYIAFIRRSILQYNFLVKGKCLGQPQWGKCGEKEN